MYVCVYVYMHVSPYMYVYLYSYVHVHMYMHAHVYVCVCVCMAAGIQFAGDLVSETLGRNLHSAEEDNSSLFDSNIACLCQSIKINNNHVYACTCMYM